MTSAESSVHGIDLGHRFAGAPALFLGVNFVLRPGQVTGLCGPSGSGKSTLLSILAGWLKPTFGTLRSEGVRRTGWVFQNPHGLPARTAIDHVVFPLLAKGFSRAEAEDQAIAILSLFALAPVAGRPFRALSGGESQRLMLARAVAVAPDLLLVDEPTAQLDTRTSDTVNATLAGLAEGGSMVVVATHDPNTRAACHTVLDLADFARAEVPAR